MINRERLLWFVMLVVLLFGGLALGRQLGPVPEVRSGDLVASNDLRVWLWERRTVDLIVQACLVFAGALGVAAILPSHAEVRQDPAPQRTEDKLLQW